MKFIVYRESELCELDHIPYEEREISSLEDLQKLQEEHPTLSLQINFKRGMYLTNPDGYTLDYWGPTIMICDEYYD